MTETPVSDLSFFPSAEIRTLTHLICFIFGGQNEHFYIIIIQRSPKNTAASGSVGMFTSE